MPNDTDDSPSMTSAEDFTVASFQGWCWVPQSAWYGQIVLYVFYWIMLTIATVTIIKTARLLKKEISPGPRHNDKIDEEDIRRVKHMSEVLNALPIITSVLWGIATINRIYEIFVYNYGANSAVSIIWLITFTMHSLTMSARGVIYTCMYKNYGPFKAAVGELKKRLKCQTPCSRKPEDTELIQDFNSL